MAGTQVDRINGLVGNLGMKAPCNCATTAAIVLSGEQTIDGYSCTAADNGGQGTRVLVKDQTNPVDNGIYYTNASAWQRAPDFDGVYDVSGGSAVFISAGTTYTGTFFRTVGTGPLIPGTSSITFSAAVVGDIPSLVHGATGKTTPVDADEFALLDSAAAFVLKKLTWANLKATFYAALGGLIAAGTGKATPVDADTLVIGDSAAGNATKTLTWANLKATLKTYNDGLYAALAGLATQVFSVAAATAAAHAVRADQVQSRVLTAYTTGGVGTAYTLTPTPAIAAYTANYMFDVIFNVACGAAPTLAISGVATPPNLVKQNLDGTYSNLAAGDFPAGWQSPVKLVSATQACVLLLPRKGQVAQIVTTQTGVVATGTTVIPVDNTTPQNTEGDQYMSLAITPTNANSTLVIDIQIILSSSIATSLVAALFQDTAANALGCSVQYQPTATAMTLVSLRHIMVAGGVAATTFKVRGGGGGAGTTTFNGSSGGSFFNGTFESRITITEYLP